MKLLFRALLSLSYDLLRFFLALATLAILGLLAHLSPLWFWSIVGVVVLAIFIALRMAMIKEQDELSKHKQPWTKK